MAIAFDATSNSGGQAGQSTYNWSHTCAGTSRYLIVGVSIATAGGSVVSMTYNGASMVFLGGIGSAARSELWGIVNPDIGTNTIALTLSGALNSVSSGVSLTGVRQDTPTEGFNSAGATNVGAADATVNVTTTVNNDWVVDCCTTSDTAITVGTGQTQRQNFSGGGSGAMSTKGPVSPITTTAMYWTDVGALAVWVTAAIAFKADQTTIGGGYRSKPT